MFLISVVILIFSLPLLVNTWVNVIHIKPEDYYEVKGAKFLGRKCSNDLFSVSIENNDGVSIPYDTRGHNCSETVILKYNTFALLSFTCKMYNYTVNPIYFYYFFFSCF